MNEMAGRTDRCDECGKRTLDVKIYSDGNGDHAYFCGSDCFWKNEMKNEATNDFNFMQELMTI